jgi:hypothetical protein
MRDLINFVLSNPILLVVVLAWVAGMVGNVIKSTQRARQRAEQQRSMPRADRTPAAPPKAPPSGSRSADEIAAEMRRILGMEPEQVQRPAARRPAAPLRQVPAQPSRPGAQPSRPAPQSSRAPSAPPQSPPARQYLERPPASARPATQDRRLEVHVDPHVGESLQRRHITPGTAGSRGLGTLGGRNAIRKRSESVVQRYSLDDLKTAFVLSEILGPPRALRGGGPSNL